MHVEVTRCRFWRKGLKWGSWLLSSYLFLVGVDEKMEIPLELAEGHWPEVANIFLWFLLG